MDSSSSSSAVSSSTETPEPEETCPSDHGSPPPPRTHPRRAANHPSRYNFDESLQASAARKPKTPHFIAANLSLQYSEDEVSESDDALPEAWERLRIYPYTKEEIVNDIRLNNADNPFYYPLLFRFTFSDTHVNRPNGESADSDWSAEEEYEPILPGAKHKLTVRLQKAQKILQEEIIELQQKSKMRQGRERNRKRREKYAEKKRLAAEAAKEVVGQGEEEDADDEDEGDEAPAKSKTPEYVRQIRKETAKYAEFAEVGSEEE